MTEPTRADTADTDDTDDTDDIDGGGRKVNGRDIARVAGVSQSTVSRVINNHPRISKKTRDRVRSAMEQLGYTPNAAARTLITGRSHLIGLVVSNITNPFYPEAIEAVVASAEDAGYNVILGNAKETPSRQLAFLQLLSEHQVDGAILTSALDGSADELDRLARSGPPLVLLNRTLRSERLDSVHIDNQRGGYFAAEHLLALGHRRIAFAGGRLDASTNVQRLEGYRAAMADAGVTVDDGLVQHGDFTRLSGSIIASRLIHRSPRPTAIVCGDDLVALGCMDAVLEAGLKVPDDVALVGFDDIPVASLRSIGLTTVRQPAAEMGARAVRLLIDRIEGRLPKGPVAEVLPAELVVRTSCGARLGRDRLAGPGAGAGKARSSD